MKINAPYVGRVFFLPVNAGVSIKGGEYMAVTAEPTRGSLKIDYGTDEMKYTVTKLDAVADANSLIQLAIAASELQGLEPMDLLFNCEFHLHYSE